MRKIFVCVISGWYALASAADDSLAALNQAPNQNATQASAQTQEYQAKDFSHLIGMKGFSDQALNLHFKLYQGYVKNTNLLLNILQRYAREGKQDTPEFAEIKRRFGWEFDGMRLHELYFQNLGGMSTQLSPDEPLSQQILRDFGSFDAWKKDFIATGAMRGIGWAILYYDPIQKRLINTWVGEHDIGNLATSNPLLVMDVWEHAYLLDYGLERKDYIKAFFDNIDWNIVKSRYPQKK